MPLDPVARQTLPFIEGKDSMDGKAVHALAFSTEFPYMKRMKAFKFRLVPTPEQESLLSRHAGCVRFVWNKALDLQTRRLEAGIPLLSCGDLAKLLTLWRSSEEYGFLANGPVHPQQQTLKNLDRALREEISFPGSFSPRWGGSKSGSPDRSPAISETPP